MNFDVIYSSSDVAGSNIAEKLKEMGGFKPRQIEGSVLFEKFEDKSGPYIVLSRHSSAKRVRALTCHFPGNWTGEAKYGGRPREVCIALPDLMKSVAMHIRRRIHELEGYEFTLEVTHHGPSGNFPMMFVEIGSCEEDWGNKKAAEIIADAVSNARGGSEGEVVMGVGGPHYAPDFTRVLDKYRIGHIIPQYAVDDLEFETFKMGLERCTEKVERVLIAWKGLDAAQREKITRFCNEYGIEFIKYK